MMNDQSVRLDRMRFTKNTTSSRLVLLAIVLDALYFVSLYRINLDYYYNMMMGASILYNLIFMLAAFLASEGVKNRKTGYTGMLIGLGIMQFVRIFYLPAKAVVATVKIQDVSYAVMDKSQYIFVVAMLAISGVMCIAGAIISFINNKTLADYNRAMGHNA